MLHKSYIFVTHDCMVMTKLVTFGYFPSHVITLQQQTKALQCANKI